MKLGNVKIVVKKTTLLLKDIGSGKT